MKQFLTQKTSKCIVGSMIFCFAFLVGVPEVNGQFWGAKQSSPITTPKDSLKKGEFIWYPELATKGPILVIVGLDEQKAFAYRNGVLIGVSTASTGKKGHETPTGVFVTILKDAKHRSSKYNNAPMPYTQKFTNYGVALHAGGLPGYPSSHGCVHLPSEFARQLFVQSPLGMTIVVTKSSKYPDFVNHPFVLSPVTPKGKPEEHKRLAENEKYRWTPEKSPSGALSILLSKSDARMVVLRNGIEIGRCKIQFNQDQDTLGTVVYVAVTKPETEEGAEIKWMAHSLQSNHYTPVRSNEEVKPFSGITMHPPFQEILKPLLTEGTTLVVTDMPILRKTSGKQMAILSSNGEAGK